MAEPEQLPPLADAAVLARWTQRDPSDPALADAIASASARFRGAVGHPVTLVEDDEIWLDGDGSTVLLLPAGPVAEVTEVAVVGTTVADYEVSRATSVLTRAAGWPAAVNAVRVVYTHGYAEVPDDVADAVLHEARTLLALEPGLTAMTVGGESVSFATAVVGAGVWTETVARYRLGADRP